MLIPAAEAFLRHALVILAPSPGPDESKNFIINLFGSLDLASGQQFMKMWAYGGYKLNQKHRPVDSYWHQYVRPQGNELLMDQNFLVTVLQMRAERLSSQLFADLNAGNDRLIADNRDHFEKLFRKRWEQSSEEVRHTYRRMGLGEKSYLDVADQIVSEMEMTTDAFMADLN
jgi:hypothetical protein